MTTWYFTQPSHPIKGVKALHGKDFAHFRLTERPATAKGFSGRAVYTRRTHYGFLPKGGLRPCLASLVTKSLRSPFGALLGVIALCVLVVVGWLRFPNLIYKSIVRSSLASQRKIYQSKLGILKSRHVEFYQTMAYAIARLAKLKKGNLSGSAAHTARTRPTPNADKSKQNIRFIGSTDPEQKLEDLVQAKIKQYTQKRKIRPDAVYCVELLLTASPSYFRPDDPTNGGYYEKDKLKVWFEAAQKWLISQYSDRIVRAELHLDEVTPHIHAYFVPLDENGQLRCNHFFDGRQKMLAFQDSHYAAVEHLGLERGIKGSVAKHQDIKDFYRIVEEGKDLDRGELSPEQLQAKAADRDRAVKKKSEMEETAKRLAIENERLQQRIKELETENFKWRQQADLLRDLPLEDVAWHLGLTKTKDGKWKGEGHIINIDGSKWYDFAPGADKGRGGAIDLVMHINECNFKQAIAWLHVNFSEEGMLRAARAYTEKQTLEIVQKEPVPQFTPPAEDSSQWAAVSSYLTQKRGLPKNLVQHLHDSGLVYADSQQNAVFVMRNLDGLTTGAFLRGTKGEDNTFMGYAKGSKRADGWFYIQNKSTESVQKVVLCKSPIEALSLAAISIQAHKGMPQEQTMYLAADSPKSLPVEYLKSIPTVVAAYDNDKVGDEISKQIQELLPQATLVRPTLKDWNEQFLERLHQQAKQKQHKRQQREIEL